MLPPDETAVPQPTTTKIKVATNSARYFFNESLIKDSPFTIILAPMKLKRLG
jgi:hypothetical protein